MSIEKEEAHIALESSPPSPPSGEISDYQDDVDDDVHVGWRTWMAALSGCSCVFSGYFTGLMLGGTANNVMDTWNRPDLAVWMPNGFAIVLAALGGLVGQCSDKIGRKYILIGGVSICIIGNILIAAAQNPGTAIVGSCLTSGLFANQGNFFSIPAEVLPRRFRGLGATLTVSAGGLGATLGFLFSGATIQDNTLGLQWRSGFIFGAVLNLLAISLLFFFYNPLSSPKAADKTVIQALREQVDWVGAALLVAGVGLFMIGLTLGGNTYHWNSGIVIGILCAGGGVLGVLAIHQVFVNKHGILDGDLWTRNFCVGSFGCFVEGIVFFGLLLLFPTETAILWEKRPFQLDCRMLLFFTTSAIVAPFVGWYTRVTRDLKYPLMAGWTLVTIGFIVLSQCNQHSSGMSLGGLFIIGVGFSTPLALLFAVSQLATAPHLLGLTTGQLIAARGIGQAVGASVLVAVYKAKVMSILPRKVSAAAAGAGLSARSIPAFVEAVAAGNATLIKAVPGVTPKIIAAGSEAAIVSQVHSLRYGWYTALPFAIVALLLAGILSSKQIKSQMTWLVERPVAVIEHVHHDTEKGDRRHSVNLHIGRRGSATSGRRASAVSESKH